MVHWDLGTWVLVAGAALFGLCGLYLLVDALSVAASRAYFAEKEKHIKRVIEIAKEDDPNVKV